MRQKLLSKDIKDPTVKDAGSKKQGNNGEENEAEVNKTVVHAEGAIGNEEDMNDDMNAEQVDGGELAQEFEAEANQNMQQDEAAEVSDYRVTDAKQVGAEGVEWAKGGEIGENGAMDAEQIDGGKVVQTIEAEANHELQAGDEGAEWAKGGGKVGENGAMDAEQIDGGEVIQTIEAEANQKLQAGDEGAEWAKGGQFNDDGTIDVEAASTKFQHPAVVVSAAVAGTILQCIIQRLKDMGLVNHLTSKTGGGLNHTEARTTANRFAAFLDWIQQKTPSGHLPHDLEGFICHVIQAEYADLGPYAQYLDDIKGLVSSTIINHINDIVKGAKWFVLINMGKSKNVKKADLEGLLYISTNLKKNLSKDVKGAHAKVTMESEVYLRHQPEGGLRQLQEQFKPELEKLKRLLSTTPFVIGAEEYRWFCGLMYVAMYIFAPQGRKGGIESITLSQYPKLRDEGYAETTNFKTHEKWTFQMVIMSTVSNDLVIIFHDRFRPLAVQNFVPSKKYPKLPDNLWLSWDGTPDNIGVRITQWIKQVYKLDMNSTKLRSLVETSTAQLEKNGDITSKARAACSGINGHTSQVAKNHYVKEDRIAEVHIAREALGPALFNTNISMLGPASPSAVALPLSVGHGSNSIFSADMLGSASSTSLFGHDSDSDSADSDCEQGRSSNDTTLENTRYGLVLGEIRVIGYSSYRLCLLSGLF